MKKYVTLFLFFFAIGIFHTLNAQNLQDLEPDAYFDFWVGDWELTWVDANGDTARGTNKIERILDGKVLKENFEALSGDYGGFKGKSYSVYNPRTGTWKQTWVDNQGGYLDFTGKFEGNIRIFERKGINSEGQEILQRMVFYDITEDSLKWDWEISEDNGSNWQLRWRIFYKKKK